MVKKNKVHTTESLSKDKTQVKRMTKEEKADWNELCEYVKLNILKYGDDLKIPKYLVLRLKGLSTGNFISNKNTKADGEYSFKCILITFKICRHKILNYIEHNQTSINDENHKINLIMSFVEREINDVKIRMKQADQQKESIVKLDVTSVTHEGAEPLVRNDKNRVAKKLKHLW